MRAPEIDALARRHVPGRGPVLVESVGRGLGSETFRVSRDGVRYSLRVAPAGGARAALDDSWEYRVRTLAGRARLGPTVLVRDRAAGILVAGWVEGCVFDGRTAGEPSGLARVAAFMRRIHALAPPEPAYAAGPAEWIAGYERAMAGRARAVAADAAALRAECGRRIRMLERLGPALRALCHSDLHPLNLVETGGALVALDWEYAHVNDRLWDLAGWSRNCDLDARSCRDLLAAYLGRQPEAAEWSRFGALAWLYDYVCLLWSEAYLGQHVRHPDPAVLARAQRIASRLGSEPGGSAAEVPAD